MRSSGTESIPPAEAPTSASGESTFLWIQVIGYALPIAFILGIELWIVPHAYEYGENVTGSFELLIAVVVVSTLAVSLFAGWMFRTIRRSQRQVMLESRQLVAINAVTSAVRDEVDVDQILSAARTALLDVTCAKDVEFEVWDQGLPGADPVHSTYPPTTWPNPCDPARECRCTHVPLAYGAASVGWMRVEWPTERSCAELTGETLQAIGRQVAFAIDTSHVVADLRRHDVQGRALHEIMMGISRQEPVATLLELGVNRAREMMLADGAEMRVRMSVAASVHRGNEPELPTVFVSGVRPDGEESQPEGQSRDDGGRSLDAGATPGFRLSVPLREHRRTFGALTVVRSSGPAFTAGDREHLQAVADVCATALANAQVRVDEHHGAILDERQRIARELHDSLAQVLAVTHLRLRTLAAYPVVTDDPTLLTDVEQIADVCADAYSDVREAILGLHDGSQKGRPFLETLLVYMNKYSKQCGIRTSLETEFEDELRFSPHTELQMVRVIQEALTNVRKHSGATTATVRVSQEPNTTLVVIEDDGCGFDIATMRARGEGFGLSTMRERLALVGGSLTIKSAPGLGTCVIAQLPGGYLPPRPVMKVIDERARSTDTNRAG